MQFNDMNRQRGQAPIAIIIGGFVLSILSFVGGGTFISRGNAETKTDVAVLNTRVTRVEDDIKEIKTGNNQILDILEEMSRRQGITVKGIATSTPNK